MKVKKQSNGGLQVALKPLLITLFRLIYRPKIIGRENLPKKGAFIFVANHKHDFDPLLLMSARPTRRLHFLAKNECTDWKIGAAIRQFGVIFVDRNSSDQTTVKNSVANFVKKGRGVALFPEGTRNKTDKLLLPFKYGAVSMASKNNVPLIPAAIVGWYRPFRRGLKIVIAPPMMVDDRDLSLMNDELRDCIAELLSSHDEMLHRAKIAKYYEKKGKKNGKKA